MPKRLEDKARTMLRWVLAAFAGNYMSAAVSAGLGLIAAALATVGVDLGWPYAVPFFVGVLLLVTGLSAVVVRALLPSSWFESTEPRGISDDEALAALDAVGIYIIRTRREIESMARINADMVLGDFSPPRSGVGGRYGPFSNDEARKGYARLNELGVIERESFDPETATIRYRWTKRGLAIAERL